MIAYVDASVALRLILEEPTRLTEWSNIEHGVASALSEVESLRTIDRLARNGAITLRDVPVRRAAVYQLYEAIELIDVNQTVLRRASESFPTPLGTPDAIHLATALSWRDARGVELVMATHDKALGEAARAVGLKVIGI